MAVDINEATVLRFLEDRLREKAAPKSINEEVRFLLKMVGSSAVDLIRSSLNEKKLFKLPVPKQIGKAFDSGESEDVSQPANVRGVHVGPQRWAPGCLDQNAQTAADKF